MVATGLVSNMQELQKVTVMESIKRQQRDSYSAIMHPALCKLRGKEQAGQHYDYKSIVLRQAHT